MTPPVSMFAHTSGTLNVALANKNGVVIAADSRGTRFNALGQIVECEDIYQKLFRTGTKSAMAIAGLLATPPDPYSLETISRILSRFGKDGLKDGRGDPYFVTSWIEDDFGIQLRCLSAVLSVCSPRGMDLRLITTVAGFDSTNRLSIGQVRFRPAPAPIDANTKRIWLVTCEETPLAKVEGFTYLTAGMTSIADAMLANYLEAIGEVTASDLPLTDLIELVCSIFDKTIACEQTVGGPIQMAIIPNEGEPTWQIRAAPAQRTLLGGRELVIGGTNPIGGRAIGNAAHYEMTQSFDSLNISSLFVATRFENMTVPLDEGQFFGCIFERCTFVYSGRAQIGFQANDVLDCRLEIRTDGAALPPEVASLKECCPPPDDTTNGRPMLQRGGWQILRG